MLGRFKEKARGWYQGKPYDVNDESDDDSLIIILPGVRYRRHWTAELAHKLIDPIKIYFQRNGETIINRVIISVIITIILAGLAWLGSALYSYVLG